MAGAYYNETDKDAIAVLRQLILDGVIAPGDVDDRPIQEVQPDDLRPYTQCHFFAGGGLWSVAARLAGWPDDRPIWTGSCPCQPFSSASRGRSRGLRDERHLLPSWLRLISASRPPVVFGEQVARALDWLDEAIGGMEALSYSVWAGILPSYGVGADNARERIYVACHAYGDGEPGRPLDAKMAVLPWRYRDPSRMVPADDVPGRMALLRIAGNAINPVLAAEVIAAFLDAEITGATPKPAEAVDA